MNAGRIGPQTDSAHFALYEAKYVDGFPSYSSPLDFKRAGERRSAADIAIETADRLADAETLRRLAAQGIDARQSRGSDLTPVDLATCGEMVGTANPELRRFPVFRSQARREQQEARRDMDDWLASRTHLNRAGRRIIHMRLRPLDGVVSLHKLNEKHRQRGQELARRIEYARRIDEDFIPIAIGIHHRPFDDGGALIDHHYHVAVEIGDDADMDRIVGYLARYYDVWIDDDSAEAEDPGGLVCYLRWSSARYVGQFSDENLAEYTRQARSLHRYQALGPLRVFVGLQRAIRTLRYRPARRRAAPGVMAAGPVVIAIRNAWIGDEMRPVALVRGWRGSWADLEGRYDLDIAVAAARKALAHDTLSLPTDNPEFPSTVPADYPDPPPADRPDGLYLLTEAPW